jgi:coniferyl-aldehyde dehydrogenase
MLKDLFLEQKKAFHSNPCSTFKERKNNLKTLKKALLAHKDELIEAAWKDFDGRSRNETVLAEIFPSVTEINHACRHLKYWMQASHRDVSLLHQPASAKVVYQPLGVVGVIVPWNYPILLAIGPIVSAIAAGNHVMVKPSRNTPEVANTLRKIISSVFKPEHVTIIPEEFNSGQAFTELPFDHLLFTGSCATGHHVMAAASKHLTPVTLELGGKSPAIISDKYNLDEAAKRLVFGKTMNAGQTCVAPDYVLCPQGKEEELAEKLSHYYKKYFPTFEGNDDCTSVINDAEYKKLVEFYKDAKEKGAKIVTPYEFNPDSNKDRRIPLQILLNCREDMLVLKEEIFGPLWPILTYSTLDEALEYVRQRPRPLALYYFDYNQKNIDYVLTQSHAGGVCLNDSIIHVAQEDLPFGGVGASGMGQYHGYEGFLTFSKAKPVFYRPRFNSLQFLYPPYKPWLMNIFVKYILR